MAAPDGLTHRHSIGRGDSISSRASSEIDSSGLIQIGHPPDGPGQEMPPMQFATPLARFIVAFGTLLVSGGLAALLVTQGQANVVPLRVRTTSGAVLGASWGQSDVWLGIPYGSASRWMAPSPAKPWSENRECFTSGPACPQGVAFGYALEGHQSEDCLSLSIFTPAGSSDAASLSKQALPRLPVAVFFPGGSFVVGSAGQSMYRGAGELAARGNVVIVIVQSRLGALGYLVHKALDDEAGTSGNYGMLDQQLALRWVANNIAGFGGDPTRVVLWGEGSGGVSALLHLAMDGSAGLFHGVVSQSGSIWKPLPLVQDRLSDGEAFGASVGCPEAKGSSGAECLRSVPIHKLVNASLSPSFVTKWSPVADSTLLPHSPIHLLHQESYFKAMAPAGVLLGSGMNDTTLDAPFLLAALFSTSTPITQPTPSQAKALLAATFSNSSTPEDGIAKKIWQRYSAIFGATPHASAANLNTLANALSDGAVLCPNRQLATLASRANLPAYVYLQRNRLNFVPVAAGASAKQDLALLLLKGCLTNCKNNKDSLPAGSLTSAEIRLGKRFQLSWSAFVSESSLQKLNNAVQNWEPFTTKKENLVYLNIPISKHATFSDPPGDSCGEFWSDIIGA